jgi:hypothetical protein
MRIYPAVIGTSMHLLKTRIHRSSELSTFVVLRIRGLVILDSFGNVDHRSP